MPEPLLTCGPSASTSPSQICSICRTKSYRGSPTHWTPNSLWLRRDERSVRCIPNAMDLCFQGRAWLMKGFTLECVTQARSFFERSLVFDPGNVEAMIGLANVDTIVGASFMTDDGPAWLAAAETTLIKVLSIRPNRAWAHAALGYVQIFTNRAAQGIRECEHALALDRNSADVHAALGLAKFYMGRAA